jgi:DNA replicative helicase MCM subunit Mcm2 (Cdc46/Mcm family)
VQQELDHEAAAQPLLVPEQAAHQDAGVELLSRAAVLDIMSGTACSMSPLLMQTPQRSRGSSSLELWEIGVLQENPNAIPEGETPHAVSMFAFDSLLDVCKPGDRVTVTGIYKAVPMRTSPRLRQLKVLTELQTGQQE